MSRKKQHHHKKKRHTEKKSETKHYKGKIIITQGGFGFVTPEEGGIDIFIPPKFINNAMDGDIVDIEELDEKPRSGRTSNKPSNKGPAGKVIEIIERTRNKVVGELIAGRKIRPLNRRLPDINIAGSLGDAKRGDWVEVEIPFPEEARNEIPPASFKESFGKAGTVEADINAVINEYDLLPPYTEEQKNRASQIVPLDADRKDMTSLYCITIDPIDAKDFDDAVSIQPGEKSGEIELGVHIADVSAFVAPDSEWDREAKKRGFTAYIPGNTLPMLPATLTKAASLTTGSASPAHTVIITIDAQSGKVLRSKRCFSTVKIAARLTFEEVQQALDGNSPSNWDTQLKENIAKVAELTRKMRKYRSKTEHFLELATTEIRIICDDKTKEIIDMKRKVQTEADMLIEECMLAANVAVAKELTLRKIPGLYRIHPEPTPEKILDFTIFMEETFGIIPGVLSSRQACNKFLQGLPDDQNKPVIVDAFLRSMMRASYLEKPELHFGLGKGLYSHFTSPIRRYADLIVHQQLRYADAGKKLRPESAMAGIAKECTEQEANIDSAYYAANDRLKLHYIKTHMMDGSISLMEGVIRKITSSGIMVDIAEMGIMGFVPMESLPGQYRKRGGELIAMQGHTRYKCGDFVFLQLERIDMIRGMAIFRPSGQ
jgi:ribonuclease R